MDAERAANEEGPGLAPAEAVEQPAEPEAPKEELSAEDVFSAFKD